MCKQRFLGKETPWRIIHSNSYLCGHFWLNKILDIDKEDILAEIKRLASQDKFNDGYKLLYCRWELLETASHVFLSLNPGQAQPDTNLELIEDSRGNSYEVERFTTRSPITEQFITLYSRLGIQTNQVLTGAFVPFRSPNWASLTKTQRRTGILFAEGFWGTALLNRTTIICCGFEVYRNVKRLIAPNVRDELTHSGWGNVNLRLFRANCNKCSIIGLPHLSRYRLLTNPESREILLNFFKQNEVFSQRN